jgi:hypothetical protein
VTGALGKLTAVDPRSIWPSEPGNFTPWLRDNSDALAEALGIDLEFSASEHPVGPFSLDLIGHDLTNDCVLIVENQLTPTDHAHLGQLLTYAANTDAETLVWTALSFREEHRQALTFLNELGGEHARFFGIEIGAVKIGDSLPAPLFKVVAQPNDLHASISATAQVSAQDLSGKNALYRAFWQSFLERVRDEHPDWTRATKGQPQNWMNLPSPFKGGSTSYSVNFPIDSRLRCELYVDSINPSEVHERFNQLLEHRDAIEASFGEPLSWEPLETKRASRIAAYSTGDIMRESEYPIYLDWFVETIGRLKVALEPFA